MSETTTYQVAPGITVRQRISVKQTAKEIPLTRGFVAIVDEEDFEEASAYKWCASVKDNTVYALRGVTLPNGKKTTALLHRQLCPCPPGLEVDHRDGNGLNCTRANLRCATTSQNQMNQRPPRPGRLKGAHFAADRTHSKRPWRAHIRKDGKDHHLGCFATEEEAGRAYDATAREWFGEFARVNFPDDRSHAGVRDE